MAKYIMAFDAGTTSNRCILFDRQGRVHSAAQKEFTQIFPRPGWVEHDAQEIWATQLGVAVEAMGKVGASAADIAAIGITNQRETTVVWDRNTGEPVCNAIVWQCRRTGGAGGAALRHRGHLAHLEAHRRPGPRDGLLQRLPDHALQHQYPGLGRGAPAPDGHPPLHAARPTAQQLRLR